MSKSESNKRKDQLLGEPHGTATHRLRKAILFKYVRLAGHDICYRCGLRIERMDDLSIEHTVPWQSAADPVAVFFDLEKIAFSHLRCNCEAQDRSNLISPNTGKTTCINGHVFDEKNTTIRQHHGGMERGCRECNRQRMRKERELDPSYGRK